jgi:histidinol phosphatase-like enzyme
MKYMVDIDGTICSQSGTNYESAEPIAERIVKLNDLYDQGHEIVYFTARGMGRHDGNTHKAYKQFYEFTRCQLNSWGVKYHDLILGKPAADVYIDDKGIKDEDFFAN